jgi:hypothetical protein
LANVINAGRVAVDAEGAFDESAERGRAKGCGPDIAALVSSSRSGARATVAKEPFTGEITL